MADISDINAAESVKIIGSDATGVEQTPVQSTSSGALHSNLRNSSGTEIATSANPIRIDPTGTTAQPINDNSGSITVDAVSWPLPTGAATAANQATEIASLASIDAGIPTALGQTTMANSMSVVIASDQSSVTINDIVNTSGTNGAISVSTTAVAVRVGGSNLTARKNLTALNNGTATIYWGYSNAVTTSNGTPLMRNQFAAWDAGPSITVYLIAASGTHDVRVSEAA